MMNYNHIFMEISYGFKRARRNVIFSIFLILGLAGTILYMFTPLSGIFEIKNIFELIERDNIKWVNRVFSSSFPFTCAYLFNILQLFFVPTLVINDTKRYRLDSVEALNVHSQGNTEILLGELGGKFLACTMLNGLVMASCGILNLLFYPEVFNITRYLFYWLTLNFPSLLFYLGVSSFVTRVVHNPGVSLVILAGILGTVTLPCSVWIDGLFDPLARMIPNMFSDFIGHVNLKSYLLQRGFILFSGTSFAILSVIPYPRIHNNHRAVSLLTGATSLSCLLALFFAVLFTYQSTREKREAFRKVYSVHAQEKVLKIVSNRLHLEERADGGIRVTSQMIVKNTEKKSVPITFYLNPELSVNEITIDGQLASFQRDLQALVVKDSIFPGKEREIKIHYEGTIDNSFCFLDIPDEKYSSTAINSIDIYRFGYQPAFCKRNYKLLTPECGWYPTSVPPYSVERYGRREMFTRYHLEVDHNPELIAICQGKATRDTLGKTTFLFDHDMKGISLCIGNYKKRELTVARRFKNSSPQKTAIPVEEDSTRLELFYLPEHEFLLDIYNTYPQEGWRDSLEDPLSSIGFYGNDNLYVIGRMRQKINFDPTMQYPYAWLTIVETPCNFYTFTTRTLHESDRAQGGIVFFPEKKYSSTAYLNEKKLPLKMIRYYEMQFFKEGSCALELESKGNTCFIHSNECPLIHDALRMVFYPELISYNWYKTDLAYYATDYLKKHSLEEALKDSQITPEVLDRIMHLKCHELRHWLNLLIGEKKFREVYHDFLLHHLFEEVTLEELSAEIFSQFHVHLDSLIKNWYTCDRLPVIEIDGKVVEEEGTGYGMFEFKVFNRGNVPGIIEKRRKLWMIPPGEGRAIKKRMEYRDPFIYNILAANFPNKTALHYERREEYSDTVSWYFPIDSTSFPSKNEGEFIVDDSDPGFSILETQKINLTFLFGQVETHAKFYCFAPEDHWGFTVNEDGGYGFPIASSYFKKAGKGNQKVVWETPLPKGKYEVFCYQPSGKMLSYPREYYYTVFNGQKEHEVVLQMQPKDEAGWFSLGVFEFHGKGKVLLCDKNRKNDTSGNPQIVVADAIKWVKIQE